MWSGNWSNGKITVPGIANYQLFRIRTEGQGTPIIASRNYKNGGYIRGTGGFIATDGSIRVFGLSIDITGNTLSFIGCKCGSVNSYTTENLTIIEIFGIM